MTNRRVKIFGIFLFFGALALWLAGMRYLSGNPEGPPLHFVVPQNYSGLFKIVIDSANGLEVELKNGRHTYVIPEDGVLVVKSAKPFRAWHVETATYKNGGALPTGLSYLDPKAIALRGWGSDKAGQWWVVGTEDDLERAWRAMELIPGPVENLELMPVPGE